MARKEEIEQAARSFESIEYNSPYTNFIAGAEWAFDYMEKNLLTACDNMTKKEYEREQKFVVEFLKKNNRTPTFSDCIEITRKEMIDKVVDFLFNIKDYIFSITSGVGIIKFDIDKLCDDLRKEMGE